MRRAHETNDHILGYLLPNDAEEVERLRLTHDILRRAMGNRSHLAPWTKESFPRRVLDVGTGTGDWCFDFAEEYPEIELIIGTDLSNIQPDVGPPNVQFIIDDSSQEWLDDDLDYVHTRDTNGCWEVRSHIYFPFLHEPLSRSKTPKTCPNC